MPLSELAIIINFILIIIIFSLSCTSISNLFKKHQNDEAIYMLALLKIKQSDYNEAKELIDKFILVCKSFCEKKVEMEEKEGNLNMN